MNSHHPANENILPSNVNNAVREMIKISQKLVTLSDNETQQLIQNDWLGFANLQNEKESIAKSYVQVSKEFRNRLAEFRSVDQILISQLDRLQKDLAEKTKSNNVMIGRMKNRSQQQTHNTLLTAQELSERNVVHFPTESAETKNLAHNSHAHNEDAQGAS